MNRGVHRQLPTPSAPPDRLELLPPSLLARWQGLPVHCLATPEGKWRHRFTPEQSVAVLLDTGSIGSRLGIRGRSVDLDIEAGALGIFHAHIGVAADQVGAADATRILVNLDFSALAPSGLFDDDLATVPLQQSPHFRDPVLAQAIREMAQEIRLGCPNGALFAQSLSVNLALHLCRTRGLRSPHTGERGKFSPRQWARLNDLIAAGLASELSLAQMAECAGISKPQFVRLFRNTAGTSPHQYVVQRRVERARQLIQSSALPLFNVAQEAGFASQSHLNRLFVKAYGCTPGQARKGA